jgi:glycosyltransferase involved in cell wall biosynthesis
MKPLFDICLITRNEESTLPRLFHSLQEFKARGGQINICDTGSTDNTVAIAIFNGANIKEVGDIYRHTITENEARAINEKFIVANEWNIVSPGDTYFDFAAARNDSISMSKSDYICTVDADEVLTSLNIDAINEAIQQGYTQFEYNFVFSHDFMGNELVKFVQSKFYDRRVCKWVGIIHEMVTNHDPLKPSKIKYLDESVFKLEHWQNEKTNRSGYLKGLAIDCFNNPEKDRNSHYFAREMWWNGRPWSAAKEFKRNLTLNVSPKDAAESMMFLGDIYGAMEHPQEQIEWFQKAINVCPRREPLIKLAQTYMRRNEPVLANMYATAALEFPWDNSYGVGKTFYDNEPNEILYWAKGWMGDIPGAQKHIMKCLDYNPFHPIYNRDTQFYFDYGANSIPGWMTFREQLFLYTQAKKMESVIEVGSWKGKSTYALCKSGCPSVTAIDHWKGSVGEDAHKEANEISIFAQFNENMKEFSNLNAIIGDSNLASGTFSDKSVDMIFIDAGHTYEEVRNDIRTWLPKARILICGHDYVSGWPGVIRAVDEEIGGIDGVEGTIWYKWLTTPKVSICIPTLGRPEKLNRLLRSIKENAGYDNYEVLVAADEFPPNNVGAPTMLSRLVSKSSGELVMFLGNDCVAQPNFLREAVWAMVRNFPELDGMVGLNDGYWGKDHVAPHWLASKKLLPYLGGNFFDTDFFHTGVDNILMARCEKIGKYFWVEKARILHDHPMMAGKSDDMDELYAQAYSGPRHDHDDKLYAERIKFYGIEDRKWA